jgi:hypothetical protein
MLARDPYLILLNKIKDVIADNCLPKPMLNQFMPGNVIQPRYLVGRGECMESLALLKIRITNKDRLGRESDADIAPYRFI